MTERNLSRLSVGCAFFTLVLFLQLLNHQTNGQRDEAFFRGQGNAISVIVSTHNDARIITSVLESVEESVETFIQERNHRNESIVSVQIIIVDDNSEDETALKIHRFLKHRKVQDLQNFKKSPAGGQLSSYSKLYPVSSSFGVDAKYLVVELHTASKLGPGTAKNIGVEYSLGEMLFFLDARAFFLGDHISKCYYSLVKSTDAYAKTGVLSSSSIQSTRGAHSIIEGSSSPHGRSTGPSQQRQLHGGVEQEEKQMLPANICIWRKVHSFIEGFPEAGVFDELGPVASAYEAALGLGFPFASVPDITVEPCLASSSSPSSSSTGTTWFALFGWGLALFGNSLCCLAEKAKKTVREQLVDHHLDYLRKKLLAYKRGGGTHRRCINIHTSAAK